MSGRPHFGFTLIELLISMAIAGILLVMSIPAYVRWTGNAQVADAAETVADGLRYANAEAIKRNTNIELVLDPTTGSGGWTAQLAPAGAMLKVGKLKEGSNLATLVASPGGRTMVTFDSLGRILAANADASLPFTKVDISGPGANRPLTVVLGGSSGAAIPQGTGVKICDPNWAWPDPKGCPP
jgi:type IV fimbrial biogenesis protein FimT